MNIDNTIEVLARVEDEKDAFAYGVPGAVGFNMSSWYARNGSCEGTDICGTVACLAGHAAMMQGYQGVAGMDMFRHPETGNYEDVEVIACDVLGLDPGAGNALFYLDNLNDVYAWIARALGVDEQVLRDKVQAARQ